MQLRNNLVHHFIDQHDLWSIDGCRAAHDVLVAACERIGKHFEQLRGWTRHLDQLSQLSAEFLQSDDGYDFMVNGIFPDGTVNSPTSGIVRALREGQPTRSPRTAGRPLPRLGDGSRSGVLNRSPRSTDAPAGDKCCMSLACSSCATVTWMGSEPPATGFAPSSSTWVSPSTRNSGVVNNLPRWARSRVWPVRRDRPLSALHRTSRSDKSVTAPGGQPPVGGQRQTSAKGSCADGGQGLTWRQEPTHCRHRF